MKEQVYSNLFYFRLILKIGGTEQFLYEIAKKYHAKDITILFDDADFDQLARLKKLVRCIKRQPEKIYKAKRAFYNFNLDAIDQIEADEHIFICHAIYQNINQIPPVTTRSLLDMLASRTSHLVSLRNTPNILAKKSRPSHATIH